MIVFTSAPVVAAAEEVSIAVPGIPGPYCAYGAEKRLRELLGVKEVQISWKEQVLRVIASDAPRLTRDDIVRAMKEADYPYKYEIRMGSE